MWYYRNQKQKCESELTCNRIEVSYYKGGGQRGFKPASSILIWYNTMLLGWRPADEKRKLSLEPRRETQTETEKQMRNMEGNSHRSAKCSTCRHWMGKHVRQRTGTVTSVRRKTLPSRLLCSSFWAASNGSCDVTLCIAVCWQLVTRLLRGPLSGSYTAVWCLLHWSPLRRPHRVATWRVEAVNREQQQQDIIQ